MSNTRISRMHKCNQPRVWNRGSGYKLRLWQHFVSIFVLQKQKVGAAVKMREGPRPQPISLSFLCSTFYQCLLSLAHFFFLGPPHIVPLGCLSIAFFFQDMEKKKKKFGCDLGQTWYIRDLKFQTGSSRNALFLVFVIFHFFRSLSSSAFEHPIQKRIV
jgi:hypothetical protein